jgi:hypothetical protein
MIHVLDLVCGVFVVMVQQLVMYLQWDMMVMNIQVDICLQVMNQLSKFMILQKINI